MSIRKTSSSRLDAPLNFQEKLARKLSTPLWPVAWRLLKLYGIEIPINAKIGSGLRLPHGAVGLVVHESTQIGDGVKIFQGVTIGRSDQHLVGDQLGEGGGVIVGDHVVIGAGAKILFRSGQLLFIGKGAVIGANAVVTSSVPSGEVWAGLPARKVSLNPNAQAG